MLEPAASFSELTDRFRWQVPDACNIADLACGRFAVREPERIALLHRRADGETERWSYGALQAASGRFANALAAKGVTRGDRVALLLPQAPETLIAHLAIYRMGAIAVPLASLFGAEALRYRLEHSGAAAIVTDAAGLAKLEALGDALPELPEARRTRFMERFGLPAYDADALVAERDLAAYFEALVAALGEDNAKLAANWCLGELTAIAHTFPLKSER